MEDSIWVVSLDRFGLFYFSLCHKQILLLPINLLSVQFIQLSFQKFAVFVLDQMISENLVSGHAISKFNSRCKVVYFIVIEII